MRAAIDGALGNWARDTMPVSQMHQVDSAAIGTAVSSRKALSWPAIRFGDWASERMALASDANDGRDGNGEKCADDTPESAPEDQSYQNDNRMQPHMLAHQFGLNEIANGELDDGRDANGQQLFETS